MRLRRNKGDRDEDTAPQSIAPDILRSLVWAITQVMTTAIANATVPVPVTPNTITYSFAINPYNNELFKTKTRNGKYRWHLTTKTAKGWKKDGISATVEHTYKILGLFKDRSVQFGLEIS